MDSMPPSHLADFLRRPDVIDDNRELCLIYSNYMKTQMFLETVRLQHVHDVLTRAPLTLGFLTPLLSSPQEALPAGVRRPTLPCVWPMALSSSTRSEVNRWFDQSLKNYLVFLTKSLISQSVTYNSSCLAFQKLYVATRQYWRIFYFI